MATCPTFDVISTPNYRRDDRRRTAVDTVVNENEVRYVVGDNAVIVSPKLRYQTSVMPCSIDNRRNSDT